MIVAPSILACDFLNIEDEIKRLGNDTNTWIHLDVMDSHFVPNLTFGGPIIKALSNKTDLKLDAHLMVTNPQFFIDDFKDSNIHNITFHWEAEVHHDRLISYAKKFYPSVGISLNPSTNVEIIPDYIFSKLDLVLIMSVNPGFGGQSFIESSVDKIKKLQKIRKDKNYNFQIQVDGGITDMNCQKLKDAGADNLVAGSYVFKDPNKDYQSRINILKA